ncbi:MAG: ParA family protein [Thermoleophilia bacterium]|nr:ParA family protein [Thermoleophilia bacterium]
MPTGGDAAALDRASSNACRPRSAPTTCPGRGSPAGCGAEGSAHAPGKVPGRLSDRPRLYPRSVPGRIYAVANQKGGVGKTTTAVNLAACVADAGERALVVDLDPQANATSGLGLHANGSSSYDLLDGAPLLELARPTRLPQLEVVPASADLAGAVVELARREDGDRFLASALAGARERWRFVFLDCPPSRGPLTVNALAAADRVLVPVQAEYYALEGLSQLVRSIELVRARLNPRLALGGVLLTMVDGRTRLAQDVASEVRRHFGDLVFDTVVPRSVRLAEAPSHGLPAILYDPRSPGADAYWKVAMELVDRT